jgi:hypothetical protein
MLVTLVLQAVEGGDKDLPWYIFLAGSFIVPLAVLDIGAYVRRRGGGH